MCQNNPPVQLMMLEKGSIDKLLELYFAELYSQHLVEGGKVEAADTSLSSKVVQVLSSSIRSHDTAEKLFCMNVDSVKMIESGLGLYCQDELPLHASSLALRQRTLFFFQALVTSDSADFDRVRKFTRSIQYVACHLLDPKLEDSQEMREMALSMLVRILDQKKNVRVILDLKDTIVSLGVKRVTAIRTLDDEEKEYAQEELQSWESLITNIARIPRDDNMEKEISI